NQTWKVKSLSKAVGFSKGNKSENTSDQRRALMLPQELIGMSQEREILLYEGTPPIECKKIRYYQDETFTSRLLPPPSVPMLTIERDES
ncbi:type IV secretory system conjugative DNA transfer family protein, partial [Acinetobacter baumannii]